MIPTCLNYCITKKPNKIRANVPKTIFAKCRIAALKARSQKHAIHFHE